MFVLLLIIVYTTITAHQLCFLLPVLCALSTIERCVGCLAANVALPHVGFGFYVATFALTLCILASCVYPLTLREGISLSVQLARHAHPCFYTIQTHTSFTRVRGSLMRCKCCFTFPFQALCTIQRCAFFFTECNARFAFTALVWLVPLCLVITLFVSHDSTSVTQLLWSKLFLNGFPIDVLTAPYFE